MNVAKTRNGWEITTTQELTNAEAAAITFRASPDQVVMGDFVAVVDAKGTRIGHLVMAVYETRFTGPAYVTCSIRLT